MPVARPVEDDRRHPFDIQPLGLGYGGQVVGHRCVNIDHADRFGADHQLVHVERRTGIEKRAARGDGDDGDGVGQPLGQQVRPLDRIDGDIDLWAAAVADDLAVIEHGGLVLLPLADDDDAVHAHRAEQQPQRVDGRAVPFFFLPAADPARRRQSGRLGGPHQFQRQISIGSL